MKKQLLKRMILLFVFLAGIGTVAKTQVLYVENFDYAAATSLESVGFSVSSAVDPILVQSPGLEYTGYAASGIGNASYLPATDQDAYINYISSSYSSGTTYMSALVNITEAATGGDYFLSLGTSDQAVRRGRIFAKDDGAGNVLFGLSKGSTSTVTYTSSTYSKNNTYLLVLKYAFKDLEDDVDLYIFDSASDPFPSAEPASPTISYSDASTSDAANLKKFHLRQTANVKSVIDGIRISLSWEKAVLLSADTTLSALKVDGTDLAGFDPLITSYTVELDPGTVVVPAVTASATDISASLVITDASDVNGEATVEVTSEDGQNTMTYTIDFNVKALSSAKEIVAFSIPGQISSSVNPDDSTVHVVMPKDTDPSSLTPEITISDAATISPLSGVSQDFTSPVSYTVTAEDASSKNWIVTVEVYAEMTPVYEPFDYTVGELLSAQTAGGWSALNTAGNTEPMIGEGSLSYNMILPPLGNKVTFDSDGTDISKQFESQNTVGTTIYYSFIFKVTDMSSVTSADGTHFAGFVVPASTYGAGVYLKWDGVEGSNKFYIGTATRSTTSSLQNGLIDWTDNTYDANTPVFIVGGYEIVDGELNDKNYLWVNPDPASFGSGNAPAPLLSSTTAGGTSSDLSSVSRFYIRQDVSSSTPFMELDELRIAANWASVTPKAPELSFVPANGTADVSLEVNPKIYYIAPVRKPGGAPIENADLNSLVTLKEGSEAGNNVAFSGSISAEKMVMTLIPDAPLKLSTSYYIAVGNLENESGSTVEGGSAVFTTRDPEAVATLEALSYNGIDVPGFSPEVESYDVVLDFGTTDIPVLSYSLADSNASATVTDLSAFPGTSTVKVTAEDGTTTITYSIVFSVSSTKSSDATLKEIRINGELLPGFDPGIYEYQYALPFGTTGAPTISAVANSLVAAVAYAQPPSTTSLGGVIVTAQDGTEAQYAIFFSLNPYIYTIGWIEASLPEGWETHNTIISTNFGAEPISSHNEFEGAYAFRFICPKSSSGSSSGWLASSMYPKSGILRFWLYVQLPDGNEALTISKKVKGGDSTVIATLSANDMQSSDWKEFSYEINEADSTQIIFTSSLTTDGETRIWIDDLSLRGMLTSGTGEMQNEAGFMIYPNPVADFLTIEADIQIYSMVEIYHINGQRIHHSRIESDLTTIDLQGIDAGFYVLKLQGPDQVSTIKFIKL